MVQSVDVAEVLSGVRKLENRRPDMSESELAGAFATLATLAGLGEGGVFVGSFSGESAWERHGKGDELVHILDGETVLTVLTDDGPTEMRMSAGMLTVVPQGKWHRFRAPEGVTVLTVTPQPTDHSVEQPAA